MKKIQNITLGKLNHEDMLTLSEKVTAVLSKVDSETARKSCASLTDATESFRKILDAAPGQISLEIQANDEAVDQAWRGMNAELENHLDHPNQKKREASATVYEVWKRYPDPTELPYEEEYSVIRSIIAIISKIPRDVMERAGVDEWFDFLKKCNDEFIALWGDGKSTDKQRTANQIKRARADLESAYLDFVAFVDGWVRYAEVDEKFNAIDAEVETVVDAINSVVNEYNEMLAERRRNVTSCINDILNGLI